jgi:ABC transporter DrrB family efflux protein
MRRRLDVAAALVQRPQVVFLDEPTTGLDIYSRNALWEMIRELVRQGPWPPRWPVSATAAGVRRVPRGPLRPVRDALAVTGRNLIAYRRVPQLLVFSTIQPVIFVLLFRYVFGGAVQSSIPSVPYVDYLMPGIFVQATVFGAIGAAVGLATDLKSGLLERFRSLPMARSAVLAGRTGADLARNVFVASLMAAVGFLVGFRVHTGALAFVAGMLLVLLFGYVMSWIFATVGLAVGDPETAQAAAFPVMAPLVFASSAFVPVSSMPSWLQPFAEHQPVSVTASAVRALMIGGPTTSYVLQSLAWCAAILLVFVPVAVRRYRRTV